MNIETFGTKKIKEQYDASLKKLIEDYNKKNNCIAKVHIWYGEVRQKRQEM